MAFPSLPDENEKPRIAGKWLASLEQARGWKQQDSHSCLMSWGLGTSHMSSSCRWDAGLAFLMPPLPQPWEKDLAGRRLKKQARFCAVESGTGSASQAR